MSVSAADHKRWWFWVGLAVAFLVFLFLIRGILLPFVVGMLTAYFLDPAADMLEKRACRTRAQATLLITCAFFVAVILFLVLLVPFVLQQAMGLIESLPLYASRLIEQYSEVMEQFRGRLLPEQFDAIRASAQNMTGTMLEFAGKLLTELLQSGVAIVNVLSLLLITPVVTFYLLRDWDHLVEDLDALLPRPHADIIRAQIHEIDRVLAGFVRGQLTVCFVLGMFYAAGLALTGLQFGIVIGLLTGLLAIIPYVGFLFGFVLGVGIALFQFDGMAGVGAVAAVFLMGQTLEGYFLTPRLVGERVGLHPVWVIFGMLAGGVLFGFVGVLLGVPIAAVVGVLIRFALANYLQSPLYRGERQSAPPKNG